VGVVRVPRRRFLATIAGAAGLALPTAARGTAGEPRLAQATMPAPRQVTLTYRILRAGHDLGRQSMVFRELDGATQVEIVTNVQVNVRGLQVYEFLQNVRETWRDRRLVQLNAHSNDNGERHTIELSPSAGRSLLLVDGKRSEIPAEAATTSLWHPFMLRRPALVDTLHGTLRQFKVRDEGDVSLRVGERDVNARHYVLSGDLKRRLWYAQGGDQLLRMVLVARDGSDIAFEVVR